MEIKANKNKNVIEIIFLWTEANVKFSPARTERLIAELKRICRLADCNDVTGLEILRQL